MHDGDGATLQALVFNLGEREGDTEQRSPGSAINKGFLGLAGHLVPSLREGLSSLQ